MNKKVFQKSTDSTTWNLKNIITFLLGISGIIFAIFWITGRSYASGYFSAMNIPNYSVVFTLYEYAEVSWLGTTITFIIILFLGCIPYLVLKYTKPIITTIIIPFFTRGKTTQNKRSSTVDKHQSLGLIGQIMIGSLTLLEIVIILFIAQLILFDIGEYFGKQAVLTPQASVGLITTTPLGIQGEQILQNEKGEVIYSYSDMKLLTINGGKYFFYQELDETTCKPKLVYIVASEEIVLSTLSQSTTTITNCR